MPIPAYQKLFVPLLELVSDGQLHTIASVSKSLAEQFGLTESEILESLPSGKQSLFRNRVTWAKNNFVTAGIFSVQGRGKFMITSLGIELHQKGLADITLQTLKDFGTPQSHLSMHERSLTEKNVQTPEDLFYAAHKAMCAQLECSLLDRVISTHPVGFKRIILDLLLAMGYGGTREDALSAIRQTSKGVVEGLIVEDKLGLDLIFIQAERCSAGIGIPGVRDFVGALYGHSTHKGVLITTSYFSDGAKEFAASVAKKVVLIDGSKLVSLLIDHSIGVGVKEVFVHKQVDESYFNNQHC